MATTTNRGHVSRALDFYEQASLYFGIGRSTAWTDESAPPAPSVTQSALEEPIGYKAVSTKYLVVLDNDNGTIVYRDSKWRIVPADQALTEGARWVYIETYLMYDELPLTPYRQIGVFSRLQKANGVATNKAALLPADVSSPGIMEVVDNRKAVNRQIDMKEQLSLILEF